MQGVPEVRESRFNCQGTERFGKQKGFKQIFWKDRFLYRKRSIRFSEVKVYCKGSGTFSGSRDLFYERFPKIFWKQRFLFGKVSRRFSGHEDFSTEGSRSSEVKVYLLKVLERFLKQRFMKGFQFVTERVSEAVTSSFNFSRFRKISFLKGSSARGHMFYNDLLCQGFPQPFPGFCRVCGLGPGGTKRPPGAQVVYSWLLYFVKLTPGIFGRTGMTRTVTTRATKVPKEVLGAVTKNKSDVGWTRNRSK